MRLDDRQLDAFDRDGFIFVPEMFSAREVALLRTEIDRFMVLERDEILRDDSGELRAALAMERYSEPFARLVRHPRLLEPAQQVLDGAVYAHQYKIVAKDPFGRLDFPWHQDFASWHAYDGMPEPRAMNYAVFLDPVSEFNGPITFIPGSHREGRIAGGDAPLPGGKSPLYTLDRQTVARLAADGGMVAPKGPAGSAVFFHGCLAHASGPNISPSTRYIVYLTANRVDNQIRRPTRPDYYANQDFTPLQPLADDCLLALADAHAAA